MTVNGINNTAGHNNLVFTLLVFRNYLYISEFDTFIIIIT